MEVDFEAGSATVGPAEGESFDPRELPEAVRAAGFSSPEIRLTAVGTLGTREGEAYLEVPGTEPPFPLAAGEGAAGLEDRDDLAGRRLRVTGRLVSGDDGEPTALAVEEWETGPAPAAGSAR